VKDRLAGHCELPFLESWLSRLLVSGSGLQELRSRRPGSLAEERLDGDGEDIVSVMNTLLSPSASNAASSTEWLFLFLQSVKMALGG
jgi:hypothetical protein